MAASTTSPALVLFPVSQLIPVRVTSAAASDLAKPIRARVLDAAVELFAAQGFRGTTTRAIAKKARVNETSVFRLFNSKQELFACALRSKLPPVSHEWLSRMLQPRGDDHDFFRSLAAELERICDGPFLRLMFFGALEQPEALQEALNPRLLRFHEVFGDYLAQRMAEGLIRPMDPRLIVRALVAMVLYHRIFDELLLRDPSEADRDSDAATVYTDIWFRGVAQTESPALARKK